MLARFGLVLLCAAGAFSAPVPSPTEHLGYAPGADYKLANYADVSGYFHKLAAASPRIRVQEFGRSAEGRPMLAAFISSPENLQRISQYQAAVRRLALGQASTDEARRLAAEGRVFVWIDSGLHASETAPVQQSFDLAYRMVTAEDEETRRIRDKVILIQVPVINPDGLDWITDWYRQNVGSAYETAPLPKLYQKYAGHDNNRDYFMLNLPETRHVTRMLFQEWFPQIVYNQHQAPPFPARIFVPPYAEPLNPNIPAPVMEGINFIGAAIKERFARENKPGVLSYHGFDGWWNGGLRSVPAFHNMHGILTETAGYSYATPHDYKPADFPERFGNGIPTKLPSVFYQRPWMGGRWTMRDAIDYMLTVDFAILNLAATNSSSLLHKSWELARTSIEAGQRGGPYAYIIPVDASQADASAALDMLRRLEWAGLQVHRATAPISSAGKTYPSGTYVLLTAQPFRPYLVDLMEPQKYPELKTGQSGPTKRPYDVAGWTLPYNMGVTYSRVDEPFQAALEQLKQVQPPAPVQDHRQNSSFLLVAEALAAKQPVGWSLQGDIVLNSQQGVAWQLRTPRVAVYQPHVANMDTGWTQYVLDNYKVPYTILRNEDLAKPDLTARFDSIIFAAQSSNSILHGARPDEPPPTTEGTPRPVQRPEFTGGIGVEGLAAIDKFVRNGGTLITFDSATTVPVQFFPLPVRNTTTDSAYYCPGSLLRIQVDTTNPLAFGMPKEAYAFTSGGFAWDINSTKDANSSDRAIRSVARYASSNVLASGWLSGERVIAGKHVLLQARHGKGSVILFGFRPQFRAQSTGTFKFLLNAIYLASAKQL